MDQPSKQAGDESAPVPTDQRAGKTEKEKMLAGEPYWAADAELQQERTKARRLTRWLNNTTEAETDKRKNILAELLGQAGEGIWIEPPFYCDYGYNIFLGKDTYLNFNCVILDCNTVHIGENTLIGPAVQIYAAYHSVNPEDRLTGLELTAPVMIGNNVWIGGGAIICQGVTIGDNSTIGAGSVVVSDIPPNVIAVGNPCRVIRQIV
jgi:maltose O-acetyltransferase